MSAITGATGLIVKGGVAGGLVCSAYVLSMLVGTTPATAQTCEASAEPVLFGEYDVFSASPVAGVGTIRVRCDASANITVRLIPANGTPDRELRSGPDVLLYQLYSDPAHQALWGDDTTVGASVSASGTAIDLPVYGSMPPGQKASAGNYVGSVTVTISF